MCVFDGIECCPSARRVASVCVCVFVAATTRGRSYQAPCIHAPAFYALLNEEEG